MEKHACFIFPFHCKEE